MIIKRLFIVMIAAAASAAAGPVPQEPPETIAVIEIHGLAGFCEDARSVRNALLPDANPNGITRFFERSLAAPRMAGINTNGLFKFYVLGQSTNRFMTGPAIVAMLPLADGLPSYAETVAALYSTSGPAGTVIHHARPVNDNGSVPADLYIGISGKRAVVGTDIYAVKRIFNVLARGGLKSASSIPLPDSLRIKLFPAGCAEALANNPGMRAGQVFGKMRAREDADSLRLQETLYRKALGQLEAAYCGVSMDEKAMTVQFRISPVAGSVLESVMAGMSEPSDRTAGILPPGSPLVAYGAGLDSLDKILAPLSAVLDARSAGGLQDANIRALMAGFRDVPAGEFAFGVVDGADGGAFVQCTAVKDMARATEFQRETLEAAASGTGSFTRIIADKPRSRNGVEITPFHYELDSGRGAAMNIPPVVSSICSGMRGEQAVAGGMAIRVMGNPAAMDSILDAVAQPGPRADRAEPFTRVFPGIKARPFYFQTMNVPGLARMGLGAMGANRQTLDALPKGAGECAIYATREGKDILVVARMTTGELAESRNTAMQTFAFFLVMMMGGGFQ